MQGTRDPSTLSPVSGPTYQSEDVGDVLHTKHAAVARPEVQEVMDVHLQLLHVVLPEVVQVVLQVIEGGEPALGQGTAFLLDPPQDTSRQPGGRERETRSDKRLLKRKHRT